MKKWIEVYHRDEPGIGISIKTPYEEDDLSHNNFHFQIWKWSVWLRIPPVLKPAEQLVTFTDAGGQVKSYTKYIQREYGFSTVADSGIHVQYGIQPGCWIKNDPKNSDHSIVLNYPWNYEHVRHTYYFLDGTYAAEAKTFEPKRDREWYPPKDSVDPSFNRFENLGPKWYNDTSQQLEYLYKILPYTDPYDNEQMRAKVSIQEREWIRGKWPWMRKLLKYVPGCRIIQRYIDIEFERETGPRKGSWKGGTVGCSHAIQPSETVEDALNKFRAQEQKRKK